MMVSFISRDVVEIVISILQIQTPAIYQTENNVMKVIQEGQHPLTGQRAANFRLLANQ